MRPAELRERSTGDLEALQTELLRELWQSKFKNYTNQLDDTAKLPRLRQDLARIKTILTERKIGIVRAAAPAHVQAVVEQAEAVSAPKKRATKKAAEEGAEEAPKKKTTRTKKAKE